MNSNGAIFEDGLGEKDRSQRRAHLTIFGYLHSDNITKRAELRRRSSFTAPSVRQMDDADWGTARDELTNWMEFEVLA